jgi:uncharacterized membrane protein
LQRLLCVGFESIICIFAACANIRTFVMQQLEWVLNTCALVQVCNIRIWFKGGNLVHSEFRKCHGGLYGVWKTSLHKTWAALSLLWVVLRFWHTWFATAMFENLQSQSKQQCLTAT